MDWKTELNDLLGGYFSDFTIEEGVEQMVLVSTVSSEEHQRYLSTLVSAIAALNSDAAADVLRIIDRNNLFARNVEEGLALLKQIHAEYLRQYENALTN